MRNHIKVPSRAWYGDSEIDLLFPEDFNVENCDGKDVPPIDSSMISEAFDNPIGSEPLTVLLNGKHRVLILIEDHTRPIICSELLETLVSRLNSAGISDDNICILVANGTHRPLTGIEMEKKFGIKICSRIPIRFHNCFTNSVYIGKTSRGTPIHIDSLVNEYDFLIGVSGVYPHGMAGYSGGAKIILPGACGLESILYNHSSFRGTYLDADNNDIRDDMEEAARIAGLDFSINSVINSKREICGIFAGDVVKAHRQACNFAEDVYETDAPESADALIINSYPMDTELFQAAKALEIKRFYPDAQVLVLIADCPDRFGYHALCGPGGKLFEHEKQGIKDSLKNRHLIIYSKNIGRAELLNKFPPETTLCSDWNEVINVLSTLLESTSKRIVVFPVAPIQIPHKR